MPAPTADDPVRMRNSVPLIAATASGISNSRSDCCGVIRLKICPNDTLIRAATPVGSSTGSRGAICSVVCSCVDTRQETTATRHGSCRTLCTASAKRVASAFCQTNRQNPVHTRCAGASALRTSGRCEVPCPFCQPPFRRTPCARRKQLVCSIHPPIHGGEAGPGDVHLVANQSCGAPRVFLTPKSSFNPNGLLPLLRPATLWPTWPSSTRRTAPGQAI